MSVTPPSIEKKACELAGEQGTVAEALCVKLRVPADAQRNRSSGKMTPAKTVPFGSSDDPRPSISSISCSTTDIRLKPPGPDPRPGSSVMARCRPIQPSPMNAGLGALLGGPKQSPAAIATAGVARPSALPFAELTPITVPPRTGSCVAIGVVTRDVKSSAELASACNALEKAKYEGP